MKTISVAIINFNYARYVGAAIQSALDQSRVPDEVVVVDDGSTDRSLEVIARFADRVHLVATSNNGVASATNTAVQACTGDIVVLLDSDDIMERQRLELVFDAYHANPSVDWVWHDVVHVERESGLKLSTAPVLKGFYVGLHDHRRAVSRGLLPIQTPPTSGLSWRRDFLGRIVPMPSPMTSQDNYLKFVSMGTGVGLVIPGALSRQGIHASNSYTSLQGKVRDCTVARSYIQMRAGLELHHLDRLSERLMAAAWVLTTWGRRIDGPERLILDSWLKARRPASYLALLRVGGRMVLVRMRTAAWRVLAKAHRRG